MTSQIKTEQKHDEKSLWHIIQTCLNDHIDRQKLSRLSPEERTKYINKVTLSILKRYNLETTPQLTRQLQNNLYHELLGLGKIEPLLADPDVTDILINGCQDIYIDKNGKLIKTELSFENREHVMDLLMKILAKSGKRIDTTRPYVDGSFPDGTRFNAVIAPTALDGPYISIRKFPKDTWTFKKYINSGYLTKAMANFIDALLLSNHNIIICGGSSTGKTTLLNAIFHQLPPQERIIVIEDTAELVISHEHTLRLETWDSIDPTTSGITQRHLLKNSLRMRPDRIVVGEIRGDEVIEMFQAMNTGHDGTISTIHASNIEELPHRLVNLVAISGVEINTDFILQQIASCINFIIQLDRYADGDRKMSRICEVVGIENNKIKLQEIYTLKFNLQDGSYSHHLNLDKLSKNCIEKLHRFNVFDNLSKE